jgi:hypothetical protein
MNETNNQAGIVFSARGALKMLSGLDYDTAIDTEHGLIPVYY